MVKPPEDGGFFVRIGRSQDMKTDNLARMATFSMNNRFINGLIAMSLKRRKIKKGKSMKRLKTFFLVTDIGFIAYWLVITLHFIPDAYLFKDHDNPIVMAWNWSFLPLDLLISVTGLSSLFLFKKANHSWRQWALVSLVLTFCSGLMAIGFWAVKGDFDPWYWFFNLYLMIYPLFFLSAFVKVQTEN